jgi:hypothetical protein
MSWRRKYCRVKGRIEPRRAKNEQDKWESGHISGTDISL